MQGLVSNLRLCGGGSLAAALAATAQHGEGDGGPGGRWTAIAAAANEQSVRRATRAWVQIGNYCNTVAYAECDRRWPMLWVAGSLSIVALAALAVVLVEVVRDGRRR